MDNDVEHEHEELFQENDANKGSTPIGLERNSDSCDYL